MHCSDMNKEKVHLVCWITCKLLITQSEYLYNCLYFFIIILERNVFIFLDFSSVTDLFLFVRLTLLSGLVGFLPLSCIEPLLWLIICMQCFRKYCREHGKKLILGAFDQFVFIYFYHFVNKLWKATCLFHSDFSLRDFPFNLVGVSEKFSY